MSKKRWLLTIVVSIFLIHIIYKEYMWFTYVNRSFITLTGIKNFKKKSDLHEDHYCYIEALISKKDKQKILNKYHFNSFPLNLEGHVECEFIPKNINNFSYFLDDKGHGMYGYVLYFMSKSDNILIVYQSFD